MVLLFVTPLRWRFTSPGVITSRMRLRLLLNAGFGLPLGAQVIDDITAFEYDGVRVDIPDDHEVATDILRGLKPAASVSNPSLFPIFLVAGGHMLRATGEPFTPDELVLHVRDLCIKLEDLRYFRHSTPMAIELGNEPDLAHEDWSRHPDVMAETFARCYETVREFSSVCSVLTPSVSNLNRRGFRYLRRMLKDLPSHVRQDVAFHRYPHDGDPYKPHPGYDTREEQAQELVDLAEGARLWLTETGLSEGPYKRGLCHTEEYVADAYAYEVRFWSRIETVQCLVWYQINDGLDPKNSEDHFGVRRVNGTYKPTALRVARVKESLT